MSTHPTAVKGLGEVALRVNDLDAMERFYGEVVGLQVMKRFPNVVFFHISDGYGGHPQALVLFDRSGKQSRPQIHRSTPSGVSQELPVETVVFEWVGWRSLYISDPEGNTVELVCFDPSVMKDD